MATLSKAEARKARASKHAQRAHTCRCGRVVYGNGGWSSHKRWCPAAQFGEMEMFERLLAEHPHAVLADEWAEKLDAARLRLREFWPYYLDPEWRAQNLKATDG